MIPKKFKTVSYNNHRKLIFFQYQGNKKVVAHYGQLGITFPITKIWIDNETRGQSVGIELANGKKDYIPYDQPLALIKDADYLLQSHIELIIAHIKNVIKERKLSKKYLAEQLHTSENQIQRLLNPNILNKNLPQLYQIVSLLNLELKWDIKKAA